MPPRETSLIAAILQQAYGDDLPCAAHTRQKLPASATAQCPTAEASPTFREVALLASSALPAPGLSWMRLQECDQKLAQSARELAP